MNVEQLIEVKAKATNPDINIEFERLGNGDSLMMRWRWTFRGQEYFVPYVVLVQQCTQYPEFIDLAINDCTSKMAIIEKGLIDSSPR